MMSYEIFQLVSTHLDAVDAASLRRVCKQAMYAVDRSGSVKLIEIDR